MSSQETQTVEVPADYVARVQKLGDKLRTEHRLTVAVGLSVIITLVLLSFVAASVRAQSAEAEAQRAQLLEIAEQIRSCTTPDGECAQRGGTASENLAAAIIICTNTLPDSALKVEVITCIHDEAARP